MSSLNFFKNLGITWFDKAGNAAKTAVVRADLDSAGKAELMTMEDEWKNVGAEVEKQRRVVAKETREYEEKKAIYDGLKGEAEYLMGKLEQEDLSDDDKAEIQVEIDQRIVKLQEMKPDLLREKQDVVDAQNDLEEILEIWEERGAALREAKGEITRAKADLERAEREKTRAKEREERSMRLAGLREGKVDGVRLATSVMREEADKARAEAAVATAAAEQMGGASSKPKSKFAAEAQRAVKAGSTAPVDRKAALQDLDV